MSNTLIKGGDLLDCTGAETRKNTSLFVEGNRIARIGEPAEVKKFAEGKTYKTIDAGGRTVMPGLIDCHVHPSYGEVVSIEELELYTPVEYRTLKAAHNIRKVLRAGVTSVCTPGGTFNINVALRDAIASGLIEGPRVSAGSHYLTTHNAIGGGFFPSHIEHPVSSLAYLANTKDEMVSYARKAIKDGCDVVKISGDDTFGISLAGSITLEEMRAVAEIAHLMDKKITIHARSGRCTADASRAGFDWLIHASYMNEEELGVILENRTPINPTFALLVNAVEWGPDLGLIQPLIDAFKQEIEAASKVLGRAYREGIMMMAGTDSGQLSVPSGEWHARELELHAELLGMSNMDAVLSGTRNAAFTLPFGDEVGTLEEGKLADVLVVAGDPLADLSVLQDKSRLEVIMKDGEVVDTAVALEDPQKYSWELPMVMWADPRLPDQHFVREHAKVKPAWMKKTSKAAE
ncbi:MAG: amidohydrolase family protein [Rhodospirillaceae bacterium]|nr:amidohydrolase family protein [Rhodospirillaceae bacterium]